MFLRAMRICSPQFLDDEIKLIFHIFKNLKYPLSFIKKAYFKARKTFYVPRIKNDNTKNFVSVPYVPGMDNIVNLPSSNIKIAFKYNSTIKTTLVKHKETDNNNDAGVYLVPCKDCNRVYFGESGRGVATRLKEHKYAFRCCNTNNAIFNHVIDNNHLIDWANAKLIFKCDNYKKRRIVESALIDNFNNFNMSEGSFKLDPIMRNLVIKSLPEKTVNILNNL